MYSHLKNFWELSDFTDFELGFSHLLGSKDEDAHFEINVLALDATLTRRLNAHQSFKLQGECFYVDQGETAAYLLADFRFHTRWSLGGRFD